MKWLAACLFLIACADEVAPVDVPPPTTVERSEPPPKVEEPKIRVCEDIVRIDRVSTCTIYTYHCEDGETEYLVSCTTRPIGVITNHPRPIHE